MSDCSIHFPNLAASSQRSASVTPTQSAPICLVTSIALSLSGCECLVTSSAPSIDGLPSLIYNSYKMIRYIMLYCVSLGCFDNELNAYNSNGFKHTG